MVKKNQNKDLELFNLIVGQDEVKFSTPFFPQIWNISRIKAVSFTDSTERWKNRLDSVDIWNQYIEAARKAIGIETYCHFVRNEENDTIGIMAFFNGHGNEIKVKHFQQWQELINKVNKEKGL